MSASGNKISNYISWLFQTYEEIKQQQQSLSDTPYRITEYSKNKYGKHEVTVHLRGKSVTFKSSPEDILADDQKTEAFSKKDIRLLTYLACENSKEAKNHMLGQKFLKQAKKVLFKFRHSETGEETEKSTEEIFANKELIKSLDAEDAYTIGYITANEQLKHESALLKKIK